MAHNTPDLIGKRYGMLTVIKKLPSKLVGTQGKRKALWLCKCDCGKETEIVTNHLSSGAQKSCGCNQHGHGNVKHRMSNTFEHRVWGGIKSRCRNPNDTGYKWYGARGIDICDEWFNDFKAFFDHIGKAPSRKHSVDRIDNEKGYEPNNVRWAINKVQANNRRNNRRVEYQGKLYTVTELAKAVGIPYGKLYQRIHTLKKTTEEAVAMG